MSSKRTTLTQTLSAVRSDKPRFRPGAALNITVALLAGTAVVWAGIASVSSSTKSKRVILPDQMEMKVVLAHAGLDPKSITAAGVTPEQAVSVATNARTYLNGNIDTIRAAAAAYDQDKADVTRLQHLVQSGQAQPEDFSSYEAALTRLAASTAQRDSQLQALRSAATANLAENVKARIATIAGNSAWEIPTEYLTISGAEPEWVKLQRSLANQRVNTGSGQATSAGAQHVLQTWGAQPDVAAAVGYLDTNLPGVTEAWNQNLGNP